MNEHGRVALARITAVLAILSLPAFVWVGWWGLAVSGMLAVLSATLTPRPARRGAGRWQTRINALRLRFRPHSWRPGRR